MEKKPSSDVQLDDPRSQKATDSAHRKSSGHSGNTLEIAGKNSSSIELQKLEVMTDIHPDYKIYDMEMYDGNKMKVEALREYYKICCGGQPVISTTSCFSVWHKAKKTNVCGKVIPAIRENAPDHYGRNTRIIFFDDNINLHLGGTSAHEGICNLSDIDTGEFVDFSTGVNGFTAHRLFNYTVVQASSEYRNVLVQANILDAMCNADYFTDIIERFSKPEDRLLIFADVNGTIVWEDTAVGKGMGEMLLSTMFTFMDTWPKVADDPVEFVWQSQPARSVDKRQDLRSLVKNIANKDDSWYRSFWDITTCEDFLDAVSCFGNIGWTHDERPITTTDFAAEYQKNLAAILSSSSCDGIPESWFRCYESVVTKGHTIIFNSFGVDTHRVMKNMVEDRTKVPLLTVNYKLWSARDLKLWNAQFHESRPVSRRPSHVVQGNSLPPLVA